MSNIQSDCYNHLCQRNIDAICDMIKVYPHLLHCQWSGKFLIELCFNCDILTYDAYLTFVNFGAVNNPFLSTGETLLFSMIQRCQNDIIEKMLDLGAQLTPFEKVICYIRGFYNARLTPEIKNVENDQAAISPIKAILAKYPYISFLRSVNGETLLHLCADDPELKPIVKLLLKNNANINALDYSGTSVLGNADFSEEDYVKYLIGNGARLTKTESIFKKLSDSLMENNPSVFINALAQDEATKYLVNPVTGNTLLGQAIMDGLEVASVCKIVSTLLAKGLYVGTVDNALIAPIHYASAPRYGKGEIIVEMLLNNGADINEVDFWKNTPLHYAARGYLNIVAFLLDHGGNPVARNHEGKLPLDVARESKVPGIKSVISLLEKVTK